VVGDKSPWRVAAAEMNQNGNLGNKPKEGNRG
jgi:hypothetical protein